MAQKYNALTYEHIEFIEKQHIFFVSTADIDGFINISPKGIDSFRVINETKVFWLNLTGSGNETAAHVKENGRMTIMFCSFDKSPQILRLYGQSRAIHSRDKEWGEVVALFPYYVGARQVFELQIDLVQVSCGYGVPYYEFKGDRPVLIKWANNCGRPGIEKFWEENNAKSLNNKNTGILTDE